MVQGGTEMEQETVVRDKEQNNSNNQPRTKSPWLSGENQQAFHSSCTASLKSSMNVVQLVCSTGAAWSSTASNNSVNN